ncbi:MAG: T9SS type A sorting domain-containing protein, partial [Bacteroidetes bacterium]|nr:T9SS type A sorting domain-containing protein [Bacteroidota bacterium]
MKKLLLFFATIICLASSIKVNAQHKQLWGTTSGEGSSYPSNGTLFHYNTDTQNIRMDYNFPIFNEGRMPHHVKLADGGNGKLYGMTLQGGLNNSGVIFEWDTTTNVYTVKINLSTYGAASGVGSLILYNGIFYGTTAGGGTSGWGIFFSWDPATNIFTKKVDFTGANGKYPDACLALYNSKIYGITSQGGTNSNGVIFVFDPSLDNFTVLKSFVGQGNNTIGSFAIVNNKFWGASKGSGSSGTIYMYDPALNTLTLRATFTAPVGLDPFSDLTFYNNTLYGTTVTGGFKNQGTIYKFDTTTNVITNLFDFDSLSGFSNYGSLTIANGKLYGMAQYGGTNNKGTLYEFNPVGNIFTKKFDFGNATTPGEHSTSTCTFLNGKFYGMTYYEYSIGGRIFEWDPATNIYTSKISLNEYSNGKNPNGSISYYNGKYYGTTPIGGSYASGVIFEFNPLTKIFTKKIDFNGTNGAGSKGGFTMHNGKFYGLTYGGGTYNKGVLFEWDPNTNIYTKKIDLDDSTGFNPYGNLKEFNNKLYGITSGGGSAYSSGSIFEYDPSINTCTRKIAFDPATGGWISGSLLLYNNKFYGMTGYDGANGGGTIFEWNPTTNSFTVLYDFNFGASGKSPYGDLSLYNSKFYGMTYDDDVNGVGVIFEFNPTGNVYTKKISFDGGTKGASPKGSLTLLGSKFYGLAMNAGANQRGVLFQWDPTTNVFITKIDFDGINGAYPAYCQLLSSNANPVLSNLPGPLRLCSGSSGFASFNITDGDGDALSFSKASSNTTLLPSANISVAYISDSTYHVNVNPVAGITDSSLVTIIANDGYGGEVSFSFMVKVFAPPVIPICLVTVDTSTSTKNVVVWEKPVTTAIDSFRIYREIGLNNYVYIGSTSYSALSEYTDTTNGVNPKIQSYRYKIACVDTCGNIGVKSSHHRTIHLSTPNYTPPSTFDLIWTNDYEGFSFSQYYILRDGNNSGSWVKIDSVTYGSFSYTDIAAPTDSARYIVEAAPAQPCNVTIKNPTWLASSIKSSKSNTSDRIGGSTPMTLAISSTNISCNGQNNGTATATPADGTAPYTYLWSPGGQTTQTATGLSALTYTVSVTDSQTITATETITITQPAVVSVSATNSASICVGDCATLTANASGGNGGFTYLWQPGGLAGATVSVCPTTATVYTVTATDINSCTGAKTSSVTISTLPPATPGSIAGSTTLCQGSAQTYSVAVVSGATSYSWTLPSGWTGASSTNSINATASATSGTITVTANSSCGISSPQTLSVTVFVPVIPTVTPGGATTFCQGGSVILISSSGTGNLWSNSATTQFINVTTSGNYFVTVTDANGCAASSSPVNVTVHPTPNATITPSGPTTFCQGGNVMLISGSSSGNVWSTSATTQFITVTTSGNYSLTVTDANGCTANSSLVTVTVDAIPTASITVTGTTTFCQGGSVTLTGQGGSSYSWSTTATTQSISVNQSGTYTVIATNTCGSSNTSASVTVNSLPTVTFSPLNPDTVCLTGGSFALTGGSPIGGTYSGAGVSAGNFDPATAGSGLHTLIYTYTDANLCTNSDSAQVYVDLCTGIANTDINSGIIVYPNPNHGSFTVIASEAKQSQIKIYNTLGELVYQTSVNEKKTEIKIP